MVPARNVVPIFGDFVTKLRIELSIEETRHCIPSRSVCSIYCSLIAYRCTWFKICLCTDSLSVIHALINLNTICKLLLKKKLYSFGKWNKVMWLNLKLWHWVSRAKPTIYIYIGFPLSNYKMLHRKFATW